MKLISSKIKLKTKTLFIPVTILLISFVIIGFVFSKLLISNSNNNLHNHITRQIENEIKQLHTGLSLVTSTQAPGDAFMGLEGGDNEIAEDLIKQVSSMGLDGVYFTGLEGNVIYPEQSSLSESFMSAMSNAAKTQGAIHVIYQDGNMYGYAPIIDVETPKGFIVFEVNIPEELDGEVESIFSAMSSDNEASQQKLVSVQLSYTYMAAKDDTGKFLKKTMTTIMIIISLALALIVVVLSSTSGNITSSVKSLLKAFQKQAEGDLTQEVEVRSNDEISEMTQSFNLTNSKLSEMMKKIAMDSSSVAASSSQLSGASENISSNAEEQQSKTEHAAAAMQELGVSFVEVARNTSIASKSAKEANEFAVKGGDVVNKTIQGMNNISETVKESADTVEKLGKRSEEIGDIVEVINDIAGQTNLLALNAAIEAARAGEQGRGFAVVADEVRKLAENTTSATNEIGGMIKGIQDDTEKAVTSMHAGTKEVEEGVTLSNEAGKALEQIVESVQNVTSMIEQIASAVEEQSSASDEISTSIEAVSQIARKNTDNAQSSSESIIHLNKMASELSAMVSGFKLRKETGNDEGYSRSRQYNFEMEAKNSPAL